METLTGRYPYEDAGHDAAPAPIQGRSTPKQPFRREFRTAIQPKSRIIGQTLRRNYHLPLSFRIGEIARTGRISAPNRGWAGTAGDFAEVPRRCQHTRTQSAPYPQAREGLMGPSR